MVLDSERLRVRLRELENARDDIVNTGIRINRLSKSVIYSLIKGDFEAARRYMGEMVGLVRKIRDMVSAYPMYYNHAQTSMQEFVEAVSLWYFLTEGRLPTPEELEVDVVPYINGIMDMAGELSRKATEEMIKGNVEFAFRVKRFLEELYMDLLSLEPRDYEMRKKVDYVASTLSWLNEKIFYKTLGPPRQQ